MRADLNEPPDPHAGLLRELRSLLDHLDPVPPEVTEFARAALGWLRIDAELAELLADSALESDVGVLTRSAGATRRWLTFRAAEFAIDLEVEVDGTARTLLGQFAPPPAGASVELQAADGALAATTESDSLGRFRLRLEAGGRVRLRVLTHDPPGALVETSWFPL
jgi:hypothetical protein